MNETTTTPSGRVPADAGRGLPDLGRAAVMVLTAAVDDPGGVLVDAAYIAERLVLPGSSTLGRQVLGSSVRGRQGRANEVWHLPTRDRLALYAYPADALLAASLGPAVLRALAASWRTVADVHVPVPVVPVVPVPAGGALVCRACADGRVDAGAVVVRRAVWPCAPLADAVAVACVFLGNIAHATGQERRG